MELVKLCARELDGGIHFTRSSENTVACDVSAFLPVSGEGPAGWRQQVKATVGGVTTIYIIDYYEWTSVGNPKYNFANGQRVTI